jgi:hypothetical protein
MLVSDAARSSRPRGCNATAPPLQRHCNATAPPLHRHCTATATPLHRHCIATATPLQRHCNLTNAESSMRRQHAAWMVGLLKQHLCKLARDAANRVQRALEVFQQIVHVLYANAQSARTNLSM